MATQSGTIKLRGKLGDHIHYQVKDKIHTRTATKGINQSEASKKSSREFGYASADASLFFQAIRPFLRRPEGRFLFTKCCKLFTQISSTGPLSLKGQRRFTDGDFNLLRGLELYKYTALNTWMLSSPTVTLVPSGNVEVFFSKQRSDAIFNVPENTNGVVLKVWCAAIDFENKTYQQMQSAELVFKMEYDTFPKSRLNFSLHPVEGHLIVVALQLHLILENSAEELVEGFDRRYTAGQLLNVGYVKNGEFVHFTPEEVQQPTIPPTDDTPQGVAWIIEE